MDVSDWQSTFRAAWNTTRATFASELPKAVLNKQLSDQTSRPEILICGTLNRFSRGGSAIWTQDGNGTMTLTNIVVTGFDGLAAQDAQFNGYDISLPFSFALLQVTGRYSYGQPCALMNFGKKGTTTTLKGNGAFTEKRESGKLAYGLLAKDPDTNFHVEYNNVVVDGKRTATVKPDGEPDNDILRWFSDYLGGSIFEKNEMAKALESVFKNSQFTKDMIAKLNGIIGAARSAAL